MLLEVGLLRVHDLVVGVDARWAPHHHPLRLELHEGIDGVLIGVLGQFVIALSCIGTATAEGASAHGDKVHFQQLEDVIHGTNHVGCAQYVAP